MMQSKKKVQKVLLTLFLKYLTFVKIKNAVSKYYLKYIFRKTNFNSKLYFKSQQYFFEVLCERSNPFFNFFVVFANELINFFLLCFSFLSNLVTAVLTHHLSWINTVISSDLNSKKCDLNKHASSTVS